MSIYLAGKYTSKERLSARREQMRRMGYNVTSSWLDEVWRDYDAPDEVRVENAHRDFEEIEDAHCLIIDTFDESATGGREVEMGYAMYKGITVVLVGPKRNVFHYIVNKHFETWDDLLDEMAADAAAEIGG